MTLADNPLVTPVLEDLHDDDARPYPGYDVAGKTTPPPRTSSRRTWRPSSCWTAG